MAHRLSRSRRDPAWIKAPLLLLRYPGIFSALLAGALLLSLTTATYPLLLDGSASRLLQARIAAPQVGRYGVGITYMSRGLPIEPRIAGLRVPGGSRGIVDRRGAAFSELVAPGSFLGEVEETLVGPEVAAWDPRHPKRLREAVLAAGQGASAHIRIIQGRAGDGVWIPDLLARGLRLGVGDEIAVGSTGRAPVMLPIGGVYRSLFSQPRSGYWRPWDDRIYPLSQAGCSPDCPVPPQFILLDRDRLLALAAESSLGGGRISAAWQAPLRKGLSLSVDDAEALGAFFQEVYVEATAPHSRAHRILGCCPPSRFYLHRREVTLTSQIGDVLDAVRQRVGALEAPGGVLRFAAILVAGIVLAAAGFFSVSARSTEFRLLSARGSGPLQVGARAAVEAGIPSILGGAVGLGAAFLLVRAATGGARLAPSAARSAMVAGIAALGASVLALGMVAAATFASHSGDRERRRARLLRMPWELPVLGFAAFAGSRLPASLGSAEVAHLVRPPSPYLLLFPVALIAGLAGLGARLFRQGARLLRGREAIHTPPGYLALNRLAAASTVGVVLVTGTALCLGIFFQGQASVRSVQDAIDAKAKVFVGSDVRAWVGPDTEVPPGFPLPVTKVARAAMAGVGTPGGVRFDLLGVDPSTLADGAYWNEDFAEPALPRLASLLGPGDGALPVIVAGAAWFTPEAVEMSQRVIPVRVVAHADAFPGMVSRRPLLVASAGALEPLFAGTSNPLRTDDASTELWMRGSPAAAREALLSFRILTFSVITAQQVKDLPQLAAVLDTFTVLQALGLATAVFAIIAMLMYLQARHRSQVVARGLSLRMGMTPGAQRRSLIWEIGSMLLAALALGVVLGGAVAVLVVRRLDPIPVVLPDPTVTLSIPALASLLLALVAVSVAGAWFAERRAASIDLGEAMRVAE